MVPKVPKVILALLAPQEFKVFPVPSDPREKLVLRDQQDRRGPSDKRGHLDQRGIPGLSALQDPLDIKVSRGHQGLRDYQGQ